MEEDKSKDYLKITLKKLDGKGYGAYKRIKGSYRFDDYRLVIEYVQGDPYASPSNMSVEVPQDRAGFPEDLFQNQSRKIALEDFLTRKFYEGIKKYAKGNRGSGKSGLFQTVKTGQEILERTSAQVDEEKITLRFFAGLPAKGRRILGIQAQKMLLEELPRIVEDSLFYENLDSEELRKHVDLSEDADWIRDRLKERGLVAFVANDSILPRKSGVDDRPMEGGVPFHSPESLEVEFDCPHRKVRGMGIPEGVTLIVGGGYHGKSTLLDAIALGVYNHIPEDGRELVVTLPDAVKNRSEDGRFIEKVDISPFISDLPDGTDTSRFSSQNASGSTSQAANIMESLEMDSSLLLIDEDTSATNFMLRDRRMQELVPGEKEPITPVIDSVRTLSREGISTILVMGGSGDFFDVADTVIMLDSYQVKDVTQKAKEVADKEKVRRKGEGPQKIFPRDRTPEGNSFQARKGRKVKIRARGLDKIQFGRSNIDLGRVEQLVERGQTRFIGDAMYYMAKNIFNGEVTLKEGLEELETIIEEKGMEEIIPHPRGNYSRPRKLEITAAINRLRTLECGQKQSA